MNTWKVILATLVIFITGLVTGGLLVGYADRASVKRQRLFSRENVRLPANSNPGPFGNQRDPRNPQQKGFNPLQDRMPRGLGMEFLQKLDSEIQLTSEQHERIEKIITDGQLRNKEIWERFTPELRREMAETQKRIREELTPEQRSRFEELMKQSRLPGRRDEPMQPGMRPRDQHRPLPPNGEGRSDGAPPPRDENP